MKKILSIFLIIALLTINTFASDTSYYKKELEEVCLHTNNTTSDISPGSVGGEWLVVGLSQANPDIKSEYFNKYITNLTNILEEKSGILSNTKNTEYSRAVIALTSIGKNATDISGYNLVTPLLNYEKTVKQGVNGAIWALIALNCGNYYPEEKELRKKYIDKILSVQGENGGFSLSKSLQPDPDVTAMAIQALSFYKEDEAIAPKIQGAEEFLKKIKNFPSSESVSQTLTALTSLGKNSLDYEVGRLLEALYEFKCDSGGYCHILSENKENKMATEQVLCALSSLKKADETGEWLYSFNKPFSDISECFYEDEIYTLTKAGIIGGRTENMFFPESDITLAELCTMTAKALKLKNKDSFSLDAEKDTWFFPYMSAAYSNKIMEFSDKNEIYPENKVTYAQAKEFFTNCVNFLEKEDFDRSILKENGFLSRAEAAKIIYEIIK